MDKTPAAVVVLCALLAGVAPVAAMDTDGDHGWLLVEFGASSEGELSEHATHVGPTLGIEFEPAADRLEIEFGATRTSSPRAANWDLDLQLQKSFRVSPAVEVEPGLGPSWSHAGDSEARPAAWGAEASIDIIFWRSKRFGWFLEPSCDLSFANGAKTSIALSGGIVFSPR